jgi:transcription initiation factor TFIIIB Brf1 subunit/transcription initiation factor TFIIB
MNHFKKGNYKHITGWECPFCKESKEILHDEHHGEIFCAACGLILSEVVKF